MIPRLHFELQFLHRQNSCPKIPLLLESLGDIHRFPELPISGIPLRTHSIYNPSHPPILNKNVQQIQVSVRKVDDMRFRMDSATLGTASLTG